MSSSNLGCPGCRIRVRASAPAIGLLEGRCPICGETLQVLSSAACVMGFRSFDLDALAEQDVSGPPITPGDPVDLASRRGRASARDDVNVQCWADDGSSVASRAVAQRLPAL